MEHNAGAKVIYLFLIHILTQIHIFHIFNLANRPRFGKTICNNFFKYDNHFQQFLRNRYVRVNYYYYYFKKIIF